MTSAAHLLFGLALSLLSWRALEQGWLADSLTDPWAAAAIRAGIPFVALAGTALSLAAGRLGGDPARAFRHDACSAFALVVLIFFLAMGGMPRDTVGLFFVLAVATRLAPAAWWTVRFGAPPLFVFALCLAFYAPLAGWRVAASLPLGDQVFYLLSAERLAHGSLDASIDPRRFFELLGIPPQPIDAATHVADAPAGPRLVQGYALPALLAPGWLLGGEVGATLVVALFAAWAATQTWLLLGETVPDRRAARVAWALAAFSAPLALVAIHIYPNAVGAALIVTGFRYAFTARHFAAGAGALVILAALVSFVTFGVPLPYAGYIFGTSAAQTIDPEPTWTFRFWIGLPALLFDRVFGVAGTAPWLLLAALGLVPALRNARARLLPAATTVGASLALLSLFRLWEGGYAPPNRYLVDVLPLAAPFVAFGLAAARGIVLRALAGIVIGTSALLTLFLLAVPTAALNSAFDDKPRALLATALGIDPFGWLPSFQPTTPDWWIAAYLRLVPALALVALLAWLGARRART